MSTCPTEPTTAVVNNGYGLPADNQSTTTDNSSSVSDDPFERVLQFAELLKSGNDEEVMREMDDFDFKHFFEEQEELMLTDIIPLTLRLLGRFNNPELQLKAAKKLELFASNTDVLIGCGAMPQFIALLKSGKAECRQKAACTITSMIKGRADVHNIAVSCGALPALLRILKNLNQPVSVLQSALATVSIICCDGPKKPSMDTIVTALPALGGVLSHSDTNIVVKALNMISTIKGDKTDYYLLRELEGALRRRSEGTR